MGILDRIFRRRPPVELVDAELGVLRQERGEPCWSAYVALDGLPAGSPAHIEMGGGDDGPDERSRGDALTLLARWRELLDGEAVDTLLEMELAARDGDPSRVAHGRTSILEEYELQSVHLQSLGKGADLEIGFQPRSDPDHFFRVCFTDWKPAGCSIDD